MMHAPSSILGAVVAAACLLSTAAAEDVVLLTGRDGGASRVRVTGTVVDYTGEQLTIKLASGAERTYPGEQVVSIETERSADHVAADEARQRGDFRAATALYDRAVRSEQRRWTRRMLVAQLVGCYRLTQQWERAGDWFLLLLKDDPQTPYFDELPLAWIASQPPAGLESKAGQWLESPLPAARLMAASHLLASAQRGPATAALKKLTLESDPRIALLAEAQLWRTAAAAGERQLGEWETAIERLPSALRAGPYLVLGKAWLARGDAQQAALTLLRIPILHSNEPALAAEALWSAAQALEKTDGTSAVTLYRELLRDHPEHPVGQQVRNRLEQLDNKS